MWFSWHELSSLKLFLFQQKDFHEDFPFTSFGSLRMVVNSSSGVVGQNMLHDEFGVVLSDTSPGLTPFGYAGGLYSSESGMVRFGARDYDPETGRWLSKDPIRFTAGDPNLYGYVLQDPINKIDPSGLADWWQVGRGFAGVIGGSAIAGGGVVAGAVVTGGSCALAAPAGIALGAGSVVAGGQLIYNGLADIIGGFNAEPPPVPYSYPQ